MRILTLTATALLFTAAGCGEPKPIAVAGMSRTVAVGQVVQLDGSGSSDSKMQPLSYQWQFIALPSGSQATLSATLADGSTAVNPSFLADAPGAFIVRLTVRSASGVSEPSDVTITATPCAPMIGPLVATPGMPATLQVVQLSTTVSEACDEKPPFGYAWSLSSTPPGSHSSLTSASATKPSFVPDTPGDYVVNLRVTDSVGRASDAAPLIVTASTCGGTKPVAQIGILAPITIAAPVIMPPMVAAQFLRGETVQLDGSTSSTADNLAPCSLSKALHYQWRFVSLPTGSGARLNDPQVVNPSFDIDTRGIYVLELVVVDSVGLQSAPVRVQINGIEPQRVTVPSGSGLYNSLILDPSTSSSPKIAFYNSNNRRAEIAVCSGLCDTAPSWTIHTIDNGGGLTPSSTDVGSFISLGVKPDGTLFAGYYDVTNCRAVFAFSTNHGTSWTSWPVDANTACAVTARNGMFLSLAVSPVTGNPAIAYQYNNNGTRTLKYAVCTANCTSTGTPPTWVFSTADATNANTGYYTSLAFDPTSLVANKPAIAYRVDSGASPVMYAACSAGCDTAGATWAFGAVDTNLGGISTNFTGGTGASLAFATTGAPSIAYRDEGNTALRYATCTGGSCTTTPGWAVSLVDGGQDVGEFPSLQLSPAAVSLNLPRITYRDVNNQELRLATLRTGGWQLTRLDTNNDPRMSSLKLSAADGVRASYNVNGNGGQLRYVSFGP